MMAGQIARRVRRDRHLHGQAVRRPDRLRRPHALPPGRRRDRPQPVPRRRPTRAAWACRGSAYHFLGGVLAHARRSAPSPRRRSTATSGSRSAPALNGSQSGYTWSPAFITYGDNNRTQMIRIPEAGPRRGPHRLGRVQPVPRLRRLPGRRPRRHRPQARPRRAEPRQPLRDRAPRRWPSAASRSSPRACAEALDHFEADPVIRDGLGPIADEFLRLKRAEWREYHAQVERGRSSAT